MHIQSVIDLFSKQLNNALNLHKITNTVVIRAFSSNVRKIRATNSHTDPMQRLARYPEIRTVSEPPRQFPRIVRTVFFLQTAGQF